MNCRAFLRKIIQQFAGKKSRPSSPPIKIKPRPKKPTHASFERLDDRIAPAILINSTTITYKDLDGDLVTVKFSKPIFTGTPAEALATAQSAFTFKDANDATTHLTGNNDTGEQLQLLDLHGIVILGLNNPANGTSITITATAQNGNGDGLTDVGYIRAGTGGIFDLTLGKVTVDGDLGRIDAGNPGKIVGIQSLTVQSLGLAGLTTQQDGGSLQSNIVGRLGSLTVRGSIVDASLSVTDGNTNQLRGNIGNIVIGGELKTSASNTAADAAVLSAEGNIGNITLGGLFGGEGARSGQILAEGKIGNITISGDIRGGDGANSAEINGTQGIGKITLAGNLWAGTGANSANITSGQNIGPISLNILHGDQNIAGEEPGNDAATITATADITALTIRGDAIGGDSDGTGSIFAGGTLGKLTIGGSLIGGEGLNSGQINVGRINSLLIEKTILGGDGDNSASITSASAIRSIQINNTSNAPSAIVAGEGDRSASIQAEGAISTLSINGSLNGSTANAGENAASIQTGSGIASIKITGSLLGGASTLTGSITTGGTLGVVNISDSLTGGEGTASGSIAASGRLTSIKIGGSLSGSIGADSGSLIIGEDFTVAGGIGSVKIAGHLTGGEGANSGSIRAGGKINHLTVGTPSSLPTPAITGGTGNASGSIFSGTGIGNARISGNILGGSGTLSASIFAEGTITKATINGTLTGGSGDFSASLRALDHLTETSILAGNLGTIKIGAVTGGAGTSSAQIFADGSLQSLTATSLTGANGAGGASIIIGAGDAAFNNEFTTIGGARSITIRGALTSGMGVDSANIETGGKLGKLTVSGALSSVEIKVGRDLGSAIITGTVSNSLLSAFGKSTPTSKSDIAIANLTINGNISDSRILAGYDLIGNAVNGNAQIGSATIRGDWSASSLIAGVTDVNGDGFGNADDAVISGGTLSKIARVIITGTLTGSAATGDHFGIVARLISKATISNLTQPLTSATNVIDLPGTPATNDTTLRELS